MASSIYSTELGNLKITTSQLEEKAINATLELLPSKSLHDDYWLRIRGAALPRIEREFLRYLAVRTSWAFDDPIIVNIGVYRGASMHCLRVGAPRAILYGVDIDFVSHPIEMDQVLQGMWISGDSGVCHKDFPHPIHMLFVDGDHKLESVVADINGWTPKIVEGGVVAFHDYSPKKSDINRDPSILGVGRAVDEWLDDRWSFVDTIGSIIAFMRK